MPAPRIPQTLADMLDNNAWKYPEQTAFVWQGKRLTHAEFPIRVSKLANALSRLEHVPPDVNHPRCAFGSDQPIPSLSRNFWRALRAAEISGTFTG